MSFGFMPYKLNEDVLQFTASIQYVSDDNGVSLYKVKDEAVNPILGLKPISVYLYFFEVNLVAVYVYMGYDCSDIHKVLLVLETALMQGAKEVGLGKEKAYFWNNQTESLSLLNNRDKGKICLCYMLRKFSVFESSL